MAEAATQFPIGIVAKTGHPLAADLTQKLLHWIAEHGYDFRLDERTAIHLGYAERESQRLVARELLTTVCGPIVVLGGDGTLISVARHPANPPATILGVNLGTLGFLAEISINKLFETLELLLKGQAPLENRFLLSATVQRTGKQLLSCHAMNDVVVTKEALARVFAVELTVNKLYAATIRGDGVIIATPAGSTAYSLAANGSIVHPQVEALLVTPICPHSLTSRPLVLPANYRVELKITAQRNTDGEVFLTIDGQQGLALQAGDVVSVTTSDQVVQFVKSESHNYFEVLASKLKWATR